MKRSIFDEQTSKALKNWRNKAMHKKPSKGRSKETQTLGEEAGSPVHSPLHDDGSETELQEHNTATIVTSVDRNDHYDNHDLLGGP